MLILLSPLYHTVSYLLNVLFFRMKLMVLVDLLKRAGSTYNYQLTNAEKNMNEMEKRK